MKRTCDMAVGEIFEQVINGVKKIMVISSKEFNEDGMLIVTSKEQVVI